MQTVDFINMEDGTREDYALLDAMEQKYTEGLADRILLTLGELENSFSGYKVSRLEHSLQGATRAHRAGESEELVIAILLHDIGDGLAPYSHSEMAAAILRPFVSEKIYWIVKHHGVFQMYYYAHHTGGDRNIREQFKNNSWYQDAIDFCQHYDQNCFDPEYQSESLDFFEPMLRRVTATPKFNDPEREAKYGKA
ncbi:MAG: putative HD phosphohydrolase [Planctomycetota bacterium]|jgi:predicted HD phosphohydrolase